MPTITHADQSNMMKFGRLVAQKDDRESFETAALYLAITTLEEGGDRPTLWFWFEEGARNNCDGQYHLDGIQSRLMNRTKELVNEARNAR